MGRNIHLATGGGMLEPKNAIRDGMLNLVLCIFYTEYSRLT